VKEVLQDTQKSERERGGGGKKRVHADIACSYKIEKKADVK